MLIDSVSITVSGGHGGAGKVSFFNNQKGPDGGNGGRGGDLYFETTTDLYALNRFSGQKEFSAPAGEHGGSARKSGRDASDLILKLPVGTEVTDVDSHEVISFDEPNTRTLMASGGIGGLGNAERKNARMTTPLYAQHGLDGQKRNLRLELKLIADFGLVGLPNAGKSSLLNTLTTAEAKVADYPFTTLEPNLGVFGTKIIADIPGLIEGASTGKGLGFQFLKHIEKVITLLHCVASDSADLVADYKTVRKELGAFNKALLEKPEIIILTKIDNTDPKTLKSVTKKLQKFNKNIVAVSILDDESIRLLVNAVSRPKVKLGHGN